MIFNLFLESYKKKLNNSISRFINNKTLKTLKHTLAPSQTTILIYALQAWWGSAKPSNIKKLQKFLSKTFRQITKAPFFVPNYILRPTQGPQYPYRHQRSSFIILQTLALQTCHPPKSTSQRLG